MPPSNDNIEPINKFIAFVIDNICLAQYKCGIAICNGIILNDFLFHVIQSVDLREIIEKRRHVSILSVWLFERI